MESDNPASSFQQTSFNKQKPFIRIEKQGKVHKLSLNVAIAARKRSCGAHFGTYKGEPIV